MESNAETGTEPQESRDATVNKDARFLVYLTVAIVVVALVLSVILKIFSIGSSQTDELHWMVPMGIAVMVIFMPLTAVSFLHFRLPQKKREFDRIVGVLKSDAVPGKSGSSESESIVVNTAFKGADYVLPVFFVTFFSILGFYILFANNGLVMFVGMTWVAESATASGRMYGSSLVACGFAFLGAYIWSIQYIFRRMVTLDLPPGAYYSVGTRLVFSSFVALLYNHLANGIEGDLMNTRSVVDGQLPLIAFLTGIFPERLLNWMQEVVGGKFSRSKDHAALLPLEMIEGISSFQSARLSEVGIENVQNLAHSSLVEIAVKTPFKPRIIADWMAQARLCLEFKQETNKLRNAGIRSILDFEEIAEAGLLDQLAIRSGLDVGLLEAVYCANKGELAVKQLRHAYDVLSVV